jgi:uncharacterized damage-inducible protein DinB
MATEYDDTDMFRGAHFTHADLRGATFRDCELSGVRIVDSILTDVAISGDVAKVVVNDVDVTAFVESELDQLHPERVQLRDIRTADDYRAMWATLERLWAQTLADAERLPEATRQEQVDGEWSLVETLRHLVFATDAWAGRTILDEPNPYHRLGFPYSGYPRTEAVALGLDLDARPSFAEVLAVRAERTAVVRRIVDTLTDADLDRTCTRMPAPGYAGEPPSVGRSLRVVLNEECEHRRYAVRDLAVLTRR